VESNPGPLIALLRDSVHRIAEMSPEDADDLFRVVCECHILGLRRMGQRLRGEVIMVQRENTKLYARIAELEAALAKQSDTSSAPS
jgi:hypothetical protein